MLPAYLGGTYDSLPKGAALPRARDLSVAFGPFLDIDMLSELVAGLPQQEAWRLVSQLTQRIVENLRDGIAIRLDLGAVRAGWDGHRLAPGAEQRASSGRRPRLISVS